jgi:hypothetical protein
MNKYGATDNMLEPYWAGLTKPEECFIELFLYRFETLKRVSKKTG